MLYLSDPVDELLVQHLQEFEGKRFKSVTKGKVHLGTEEEKKQVEEQVKKKEEEYAKFLEACHKRLDRYVKRTRLSTRLVDHPHAWSRTNTNTARIWSGCSRKEKPEAQDNGALWN